MQKGSPIIDLNYHSRLAKFTHFLSSHDPDSVAYRTFVYTYLNQKDGPASAEYLQQLAQGGSVTTAAEHFVDSFNKLVAETRSPPERGFNEFAYPPPVRKPFGYDVHPPMFGDNDNLARAA